MREDGRTHFRAYRCRAMVLHVWTSAPGSELAERQAFQARLDRGELDRVEVTYPDGRKPETMVGRP